MPPGDPSIMVRVPFSRLAPITNPDSSRITEDTKSRVRAARMFSLELGECPGLGQRWDRRSDVGLGVGYGVGYGE